jgi:hypothetical protein
MGRESGRGKKGSTMMRKGWRSIMGVMEKRSDKDG